ncbi:MAG: response regulator [candidate division Zixibacteria bacterium]|nr:response regulator [candidate division Zixibacteria bacterium]
MLKHTLLLVDDEPNVLKSLKRLLIDTDYKIFTADSGEKGLEVFDKKQIHVVISDYRMPEMNGVEFLSKVKEKSPETIRIILSGYADAVAIVDAINEGEIYKFITKPWNDHEFLTTIMRTFEQYDLQHENDRLYSELQIRNQELQKLTKSLEEKVAQRTRDLEIRNRALIVSQNILSLLPVGVLGIDSDGLVVYMNKALKDIVSVNGLCIGSFASDIFDEKVVALMEKVIQEQKPIKDTWNGDSNLRMIWIPLPKQGGVIGLFGYLDVEKAVNHHADNKEEARSINA